MLIIPVIDLSQGRVVHAKQGLRHLYQPITSVISASSDPEVVLSSFLELYPFKIIYIADLDAIQNTGSHSDLISKLAMQYKQCEFWIDAGLKAIQEYTSNYDANNIRLILGSENKLEPDSLMELIKKHPEIILSLDFNEEGLIENSYLLETPELWTDNTIVMTLNRVGSNKGIDIKRINETIKQAKNKNIYAAGGVRDKEDLIRLETTGAKGVLLASALHSGAITKEVLEDFHQN
jgi:phosphoribosylformimino-5-aminoimidazole carboxamide ribotide isomerase